MRRLDLVTLLACLVSAALAQAQSSVSNLESFPTILPPSGTAAQSSPSATPSSGATAFDPSRFPSAPGPALPYSSSSSSSLSSNSSSSPAPSRTTLVSASHSPLPSLDPSATEYVVTSTVGGSVATVTVTSTASTSPGAQAGGSSDAARGRRGAASEWIEVGALAVAAGALVLAL